jgi:hypothetical protein
MRILEGTAVVVPTWVRWTFGLLALLFAGLGWWLVGRAAVAGWLAWAGVALTVLVAVVLLVAAIRGRIWRRSPVGSWRRGRP